MNALTPKNNTGQGELQPPMRGPCYTPEQAAGWFNDVLKLAQEGDPDARHCLPRSAAYFLEAVRRCGNVH